MRPAPGVQVTSTIELVSPIAEGAMGSVWVAFHHRLQTRVAVKFVSDKLGDDTAEALARFEREASTAAQIKSPHVVQTFDSGLTPENVPYMVMELLEGESLGDRLRRVGQLGLHDTAIILTQVARALTKAHRIGIIHRDIKPDNIYLCEGEEGLFCKILDFGIAKQTGLPAMGGLTTEGKMVGTPEYLSPEQVLDGDAVDYRADLWALAVVMYASLTGYLPFTGKTIGQLSLALAGGQHAQPSSLRAELTPEMDSWFGVALNRSHNSRFNSAREMAQTFLAALPGNEGDSIELGGSTFLSSSVSSIVVHEDTERQFSSSQTTMPPPSPKGMSVAIRASLVAACVSALGIAAVVLTTDPGPPPLVTTATRGVTASAIDAADEAELEALRALDAEREANVDPVATLDLDEPTDVASGSEPTTARKNIKRTKAKPKQAKKAKPKPEKSEAKAAPPKPPPTKDGRRGKEELGF